MFLFSSNLDLPVQIGTLRCEPAYYVGSTSPGQDLLPWVRNKAGAFLTGHEYRQNAAQQGSSSHDGENDVISLSNWAQHDEGCLQFGGNVPVCSGLEIKICQCPDVVMAVRHQHDKSHTHDMNRAAIVKYKGSSDLAVHTIPGTASDPNPPVYRPGDTIVGYVTRNTTTVAASAVLTITLHGRTQSTISHHDSQIDSMGDRFATRFNLIDDDALLTQIYDGPLHIEGNTERRTNASHAGVFPFSITIPRLCTARFTPRVPENASFLPIDGASYHATPLPDSISVADLKMRGWVEYYLRAHLKLKTGSYPTTLDALLPINLRTPRPGPPITNFLLRQHLKPASFASFNLLPDSQGELSASQKMKTLLGSSKVPRLKGSLEVEIPQTMQLANPEPVSLLLRFIPDVKASSAGLRGVHPKIALIYLKAKITSTTYVICEGITSPERRNHKASKTLQLWPKSRMVLPVPDSVDERGRIYIPCTGEYPALDVGARINLKLPKREEMARGQIIETTGALTPDFKTFNIRQGHAIRLEVVLEAGGERLEVKVDSGLVVLRESEDSVPRTQSAGVGEGAAVEASMPPAPQGRSESWIVPPSTQGRSESWIVPPAVDGDAPPSFAEVQAENASKGLRSIVS